MSICTYMSVHECPIFFYWCAFSKHCYILLLLNERLIGMIVDVVSSPYSDCRSTVSVFFISLV